MVTMKTKSFFGRIVLILAINLLALALLGQQMATAQNATTVPLVIPTLTASNAISVTPASNFVPPTPTIARAVVESLHGKPGSGEPGANLRAAPDIKAEILGTIVPGEFYSVLGRSNDWLEIQYDKSTTGRAWVFKGVVNITGLDPNQIPTIGGSAVPSPNLTSAAEQASLSAVTLTPGGIQTLQAQRTAATGVFVNGDDSGTQAADQSTGPLPTFTFPSAFVEATLPSRVTTTTNQGGIPPIIPILALGGVGLLGLFISALRRL
jgi:hypothetical protein